MKTVEQYLQELPDPLARERALKNLFKEYGQEWSTSLPAALKRAFLWHRSPEKYDYWNKVYQKMILVEIVTVYPGLFDNQ